MSKPNSTDLKTDKPSEPVVVEQKIKGWFPDLPTEVVTSLVLFHGELIQANRTLSLISNASIKMAENYQIAEVVLASKAVYEKLIPGKPLYDIGGTSIHASLIFAALYPKSEVILLEKESRRLAFYKSVCDRMKLSNLTVEQGTLGDLPANSVTNLLARAYGPLGKSLLAARKPLLKGGRFFQLKGDGWANELASLPSQLFTHWNPSLLIQYKVPDTTQLMAVLLTEKVSD